MSASSAADLAARLFGLLADSSLKALVLLLITASLVALTRHRTHPRLRCQLWCLALLGAAVLPLARQLLPPLPLTLLPPLPAVYALAPTETASPAPAAGDAEVRQVVRRQRGPAACLAWLAAQPWTLAATLLWLAGGMVAIGLHLAAVQEVSSLTRRARPAQRSFCRTLANLGRDLGCGRRRVILLVSDEIPVPFTWGLLPARILLPSHAAAWDHSRLQAVLTHELVHVRRRDWLLRTAARLVCAAYWFIPLTWWALQRLVAEQELNCDQEVLHHGGGRPSTYAAHLLAIARDAGTMPVLARQQPVALALARRGLMEERIMEIIEPVRNHHGNGRSLPLLLPMTLLLATLAVVQVWAERPGPEKPAAMMSTPLSDAAHSDLAHRGMNLRAPLQLEPHESGYTYLVAGRRDPFLQWRDIGRDPLTLPCPDGAAGLRIGELRLIGVVQLADGRRIASVLAPDRLSYLLKVGSELCDGSVTEVQARKVVFRQLVTDPGRQSLYREVELSIPQT